jgi:hypothetical protein
LCKPLNHSDNDDRLLTATPRPARTIDADQPTQLTPSTASTLPVVGMLTLGDLASEH